MRETFSLGSFLQVATRLPSDVLNVFPPIRASQFEYHKLLFLIESVVIQIHDVFDELAFNNCKVQIPLLSIKGLEDSLTQIINNRNKKLVVRFFKPYNFFTVSFSFQ